MPFATIAGVTYAIQNPGATENTPDYLGGVKRTHTGSARNATRTQARSWSMTLTPILEADYQTLYAATFARKFVTCNGDFLNNVATLCWVEIKSAQYFRPSVVFGMQRIVTLDVFEVNPIQTLFTPTPAIFLLTSVVSPDDATANVSTPDGTYPGDGSTGFTLGAGLVPPTAACPTQPGLAVSATPEFKHLSVPLDDGYAFGRPAIRVETGTVDGVVWDTQDFYTKLYLVRGGVNVAGPWVSSFGAMGVLTGNTATLNFPNTISVTLEAGDRFLIEWYVRIGLACGQADNGQRPFLYFGGVPGPRLNPILYINGNITSL